MNLSLLPLFAAAILLSLFLGSAFADAGVSDVKVTTDRSIDCSSIETIARDLYRDCKTEEQKAIATWYFVRRMLFHWPKVPTWDSLKLINSYSYGLCGMQSTAYCRIAEAGGMKARKVKAGSHMMAEVWYDDAWHLYDCQVGWYALRKDRSAVASAAEMKADNSIITDAVKDGRASKPYFQCSDKHAYGVTSVNRHWIEGPARPLKYRLVLNLRRGESITRSWANEAKAWHPTGETKWTLPFHSCTRQTVDANDPVNWPFWKTYAEVRSGDGERIVYGKKRYFGNGRMVYAPALTTDAFRDGLAAGGLINMQRGADGEPALRPIDAGKPASVTFVIECPYLLVDAWVDVEAVRGVKDALAVSVRGPRGRWRKVHQATKAGRVELTKVSLKDAVWAGHRYFVKIEMKSAAGAADVGLNRIKITSVFMNNMYALPYLAPGKNTIQVTGKPGADLKVHPITLEYAWREAGEDKSLVRTIGALPFSCDIQVGGAALPRMKSVTLRVAP